MCIRDRLGLGEPALEAAARDADDADLRNVALDEGVRGLRGGVGNEHNIFRSDVVLAQAVLKALHNAGSNALLMVVRRLNFVLADDLVGQVVDGDSLGVSTADVDTHAYFSVFGHWVSS